MKKHVMQFVITIMSAFMLVSCGSKVTPPTSLEVGAKYEYSHSVFTSHETIMLEIQEDCIVVTQTISAEIHEQPSSQSTVYTFKNYNVGSNDNEYELSNGSCSISSNENSTDYSGKIILEDNGTAELTINEVEDIQKIMLKYND